MRCKGGSNTPRVWTSYVRGLCREILSPSLIRHMGGLAKEMLALEMRDLVGFLVRLSLFGECLLQPG